MHHTTLRALSVVAGLIASLAANGVSAQAFPTKPIVLVNPYAAGGPADLIARALAKDLATELGQSVVVENKPGAGASIGAGFVARAEPDGYTLLLGTAAAHVVTPLIQKVPYDGIQDFAFVALAPTQPNLLVVHPDVKATNVKELIALAKASPGKLNYGSSGAGTSPHLGGEMLKLTAKIDLVHIPYGGAAPALTDLVAGRLQAAVMNLSGELPYVKAGKLRALAYASTKRSPLLPDVPTFAEVGLGGAESSSWYTVAAPKGTPAPVVDKINKAIATVYQHAEFRKLMDAQGAEVTAMSPEETTRFVKDDAKRTVDLIKSANLKLE
ncbi:Bug family tripartite tricarboxylate transporter substrate binding protein [Pigmentiphaga litoralis]|uniref:Tripartite-type tricarboxylate transporter receptor subunit TctC n=1 Tax=Pigmentiphaga litoralis TaxID=516702 RepID=A0A7Y9LNK8_9BURK|nr:tripartite tricarboxylate transporter substrate binding protein [Pigmentiphaga litoralis]NYE26520.1 tripartite-type tricarboxylate transporter receptor subunit TctC [Pigmentiphaga litoralis]NYE86069.1 tripartite-type tricarboxylate transporter receptor subunit TctC [Pigmentiphaga litoralis]